MRNCTPKPPKYKVAARIAVMVMLASFSACTQGSEPRQLLNHLPREVRDAHPGLRPVGADQANQGPIPSPGSQSDQYAGQDGKQERSVANVMDVSTPNHRTIAPIVPPSKLGTESQSLTPNDQPDATEIMDTVDPPIAAQHSDSLRIQPKVARAPDPTDNTDIPYFQVYVGIVGVGLLILVLALLRIRDRKTAKLDLENGLSRIESKLKAHQQEEAAEIEALRLKSSEDAQIAEAAATQARADEEKERALAIGLAAAQTFSEKKQDPRLEAAQRLLDLLHRAERDVEPFFRLLGDETGDDPLSKAPRSVVAAWHEAILNTRNRLSEALQHNNMPFELQAVDPASDLSTAVSRLIDHAARMSSLMSTQQQPDSAIQHWSLQLPNAVIRLFWHAQTAMYSSTLTKLPRVPDIQAPAAVTQTAQRQVPIQDKAVLKAIHGKQRSAVHS